MTRAPIVELIGGQQYRLVEAHRVQRWDLDTARARLRAAVEQDGTLLAELIRFAGVEPGTQRGAEDRGGEAAIEQIAQSIANGELIPWVMPDDGPSGTRPVLAGADPVDWSDVRPLSELREATGWLSIEVLDHTGIPYAGLEITLVHGDGRSDRVVLDDLGRHTANEVALPGRTTVYWPPRLELSEHARQRPALDGFARGSADLRVPRRPDGGSLRLGPADRHYRVIVDPPAPTVSVTAGQFAPNSSFPSPGILVPLLGISFADFFADLGLPRTDPIYQVFGHAQADGDEAGNKALSDRRAKVFVALLVGDIDTVQSIAETEAWGLREHQLILRVLRCDPGAIDGEPGDMTSHAVRTFQAEYRDGVFHRHRDGQEAPRNPALDVTGDIDDATAKALVEALVVATSPRVDPSRMHPTHPFAGCSEFNRKGPEPHGRDRRLAIVMHDVLPVDHDPQPCAEGDHAACPIDGRDPIKRCPWYRTHVVDPEPGPELHRHFDLRWLVLPSGKLLLSAVTTVPDDGEVTFQVFRTKPISGAHELRDDTLGDALCEPKLGIIRGGIAQLVWEPPPGFSLFDLDGWVVPLPSGTGAHAWHSVQQSTIPVFRVSGGGATAISPPPGDDVSRIASETTSRLTDDPLVDVVVLDAFGRLGIATLDEGRVNDRRHSLAPDETRVLAVRYVQGYVPPDGEVPR